MLQVGPLGIAPCTQFASPFARPVQDLISEGEKCKMLNEAGSFSTLGCLGIQMTRLAYF